ncbi:hypothetical protein PV371_05305 [Streptomyces sp. TX20-6-3]|uniref:hypothetical protein n=1 Tax=Streptomyces sp. TX20-6-3 TaxID=3028705 RepID=UPI0029BEF1B8|nr:hypothetical protein [Streptomyces sp. TX20-6-3]MDX2559064.1 hypothetical protein [Streptomyces sp. TX20-6-3]
MLHISLSMMVGVGFAILTAVLVAAGAVAIARWDRQSMPTSIKWGVMAFAGALTLLIMLLTLLSGAGG